MIKIFLNDYVNYFGKDLQNAETCVSGEEERTW
jgi:hypothetical protein